VRVQAWGRVVGLVSLTGMVAVLAVLLALAGNAATSEQRWPGLVDELRQHPWPWGHRAGGVVGRGGWCRGVDAGASAYGPG
jgi:hypothetical protein